MPRLRCLSSFALAAALALTINAAPARAQQMPAMQDDATPPAMAGELKLKAATAPLATLREGWVKVGRSFLVHNVAQPTLTPFLPPAGKGNGTAVVIAPGGGFMMLSMTSEGWDVARWLADRGIAAFVLKYRLTATPATADGLKTTMAGRLGGKDRLETSHWFEEGTRVATEDALEAMRFVRANSAKWGIDPAKVGFMGFSAGAFTTMGLVNKADAATMPSFVAPIYGSLNTPASPLPTTVPPMWTLIAADDPILGKSDFGLINAWRAKGGTVEFHLYDKGGHGYGLAGTPGSTTVHWPEHFLAWLASRDLYRAPAPK